MTAGKITAALFLILIFTACGDNTGITLPVLPHDPVDEGWKVVENYAYGMETKDIALLEETLDPDLVYQLQEDDWDDYNGDGIIDTTFTRELHLEFLSQTFNMYEYIELSLSGNTENPWPDDPAGETMQYLRTFDMKAYYYDEDNVQQGWREQGEASFLCKPDSAGIWRITGIEDFI